MVKFAIALQIILVVYHQITTWLDLFPFNGVRFYSQRDKTIEAVINLVLMSLTPVGFILDVHSLMKFGVVYYFVLFAVEMATWFAPYFLGPSPKWLADYDRIHRQTINVLPRRGNNPMPNLEHLILMVLTVLTAVTTEIAFQSLHIRFIYWWVGLIIGIFAFSGTVFQFCFQGRIKSGPTPE